MDILILVVPGLEVAFITIDFRIHSGHGKYHGGVVQ